MENIKKININIQETVDQSQYTNSNVKSINVDLTPKKEKQEEDEYVEKEPKVPRKRVVTNTDEWSLSDIQLSDEKQKEYVQQLYEGTVATNNIEIGKLIIKQLKAKLSGYRNQDVLKGFYLEEEFMTIDKVLKLLVDCNCACYYCNSFTKVLYEYVREPIQWSLERIDNKIGHNDGNVTIACLNCNLRRRTMNQERYVFTKQLTLIKKK